MKIVLFVFLSITVFGGQMASSSQSNIHVFINNITANGELVFEIDNVGDRKIFIHKYVLCEKGFTKSQVFDLHLSDLKSSEVPYIYLNEDMNDFYAPKNYLELHPSESLETKCSLAQLYYLQPNKKYLVQLNTRLPKFKEIQPEIKLLSNTIEFEYVPLYN